MSLLDSILGGLMGGQAQQSPVAGILGSLLGGQQGAPGTQAGAGGGLTGLIGRLQQAGLGDVAQSWVGNGPNQPVTPQQLQGVFGQQTVNQWAQQANMQPHDLLSQLAHYLPQAVDRATPGGTLQGGMEGDDPFQSAGVNVRHT